MIVTFSSPAYGNITMFGDVALQLLKMMGHRGTVPSAITAEDVPAALAHLEAAIELAKQQAEPQVSEDESDESASVSLPHRALPLIKLLKAAVKDKVHVMWTDKT